MPLPDVAPAEQWARDVATKQIRVHEEREARQGIDDLKGLAAEGDDDLQEESPAKLDRGEVPDDAEVINRPLTLDGPLTPNAAAHLLPDRRPLEDQLLTARLNLMAEYPAIRDEMTRAWVEGEHQAIHSGSALDRFDASRRVSMAAASLMKVVEKWCRVFGDYRTPKAGGPTKLIMLPMAAPQSGGSDAD